MPFRSYRRASLRLVLRLLAYLVYCQLWLWYFISRVLDANAPRIGMPRLASGWQARSDHLLRHSTPCVCGNDELTRCQTRLTEDQ